MVTRRWIGIMVASLMGMFPSLGYAEVPQGLRPTTRQVVYVSEARAVVDLNEFLAQRTTMLAAGYFNVTPTRSSFTLTVDDAALLPGEPLALIVGSAGRTIFSGCLRDGVPHTFSRVEPGQEHTVYLDPASECSPIRWPSAGLITVQS